MALIDRPSDPSPRLLRLFALLLPVFAGLLGALLHWHAGQVLAARVIWIAGLALAALLAVLPALRRPLFLGWSHAIYPLGWLVAHVLLAAIYYGLLTPLGLGMRLFGRDPLRRRRARDATSYWVPYAAPQDRKRYLRPY